jgi:hypothetical protein
MRFIIHFAKFQLISSSVTSLSNLPMRKTHGSISSTDSGHSDAMSYCDPPNVYHLQSNMAAPLPPRRHSAVQQGSNSTNLYQFQPNNVNSTSTKQANGDLTSMPPPPNPRSRPPFPIGIPVLPNSNMSGANVAGYNIYASQQQYQQLRHTGNYRGALPIRRGQLNFE